MQKRERMTSNSEYWTLDLEVWYTFKCIGQGDMHKVAKMNKLQVHDMHKVAKMNKLQVHGGSERKHLKGNFSNKTSCLFCVEKMYISGSHMVVHLNSRRLADWVILTGRFEIDRYKTGNPSGRWYLHVTAGLQTCKVHVRIKSTYYTKIQRQVRRTLGLKFGISFYWKDHGSNIGHLAD